MYYIIWNYKVEKEKQKKFEEEYSREGAWFKLFEPCRDYLGHELIKNTDGNSYLLLDKWMSKSDYESFLKSNQAEYDSLNAASKNLYDEEISIGTFDSI